ncbi:hypothetical protein HEB94_000371 [Actinopolymorpha pittospori]|uniref:Uncharacterized protein n=1 Tax=Actinopolymorpha pittospori TaxID=648752 RepID=A0A927MRF8_9ACTN|nr:hypothetical protein [Actinopolymorpha pittospori]
MGPLSPSVRTGGLYKYSGQSGSRCMSVWLAVHESTDAAVWEVARPERGQPRGDTPIDLRRASVKFRTLDGNVIAVEGGG